MAKGIERQLVLKGEKEFNAAIYNTGRSIKALASEMKAETAELGRNATEQQKAEVKYKTLQKQIQEQEKLVSKLREAVAQAKEQYGDNLDVVQKWETKLNDARATLANMKNDLDGTGDSLNKTSQGFQQAAGSAEEAVTATKSVADAIGSIASVGESVSGTIENVFFGMIHIVESAVSTVWDMISDTAARANNWTDIAGYWNTDPQTIQQYARAVKGTSNSFNDLNSAVSKLVLGGKGDKITELLGVSGVNYQDDWAYAMACMNRLYELRQSGQDTTPIFEEIFGEKRSQSVMDLLNDWASIQEGLARYNGDETGYGLTSAGLEAMNALQEQIAGVQTQWDALRERFLEPLAPVTMNLLMNVEGGLDAIADFINADSQEERDAALADLKRNIEEFFTKIKEFFQAGMEILGEIGEEFQSSEDPLLSFVGDVMVGIKNALSWMVENQDAVKKAFAAILAVWATAKAESAIGNLAKFAAYIAAIKGFGALKAADKGAAAAGASSAAAGGSLLWGLAHVGAAGSGFLVGMLPANAADNQEDSLYDQEGNVTEAGRRNDLPERIEDYAAYADRQYVEQFLRNYIDALQKNTEQDVAGIFRESIRAQYTAEAARQLEAALDEIDRTIGEGEKVDLISLLAGLDLEAAGGPLPEGEGQENLPASSFVGPMPEQPTPSQAQQEAAEIWWDLLHNRDAGPAMESTDPFATPESILQDAFAEDEELLNRLNTLIDAIREGMEATGNAAAWNAENLPANWWLLDAAAWQNAGQQNTITSSDLQSFRGLPAGIMEAARAGTAAGVSGIRVTLDGYTVGRLVAPYVSETIARDVIYF